MKKSLAALAVLPLISVLAACGSSSDDGGQGGDKTSVVAAFYPFAFVAEQVGGSYVDVENLVSPGTEPHDLELKAKQVGAVQDADLVVYQEHFQTTRPVAPRTARSTSRHSSSCCPARAPRTRTTTARRRATRTRATPRRATPKKATKKRATPRKKATRRRATPKKVTITVTRTPTPGSTQPR
jgi:hypothetical protein